MEQVACDHREIGLEKGNVQSDSKVHVPLRAEDGIIVGKMLEVISSRSLISTKQSQCNIKGELRFLRWRTSPAERSSSEIVQAEPVKTILKKLTV